MYRGLNIREQEWLDKLLNIEFKGKDILMKQISESKVAYEQEYAFISLKFNIEKEVEQYPYQVRVPVEMRAYQNESAPIVFLLHIIGGIINELEIISADSSEIKADCIELENVQYEVNKVVL